MNIFTPQRLLCACLFYVMGCTGCDSVEDNASSSSSLTSDHLADGLTIQPRDVSETGIISPLAEATKWAGGDSGLLFAQLSGTTYDFCSDLYHPGYDMNVLWTSHDDDYDTPVYSIADGVVVDVRRFDSEWGSVTIRHSFHGRVFYTEFGHMHRLNVGLGQVVRLGEVVGTVGNAGTAYSHLHFEIRTEFHACHQNDVTNSGCFRDYDRFISGAETLRPGMFFRCEDLRRRSTVLSWYQNPIEAVVSTAMDVYADRTVGLAALGDPVVPSSPAFSVPSESNPNPSSFGVSSLRWVRGEPSNDDTVSIDNALVREYHPPVWSGRTGYLVDPINHGARHPYWVRSAFGERWIALATGSDADAARCGMPVTGEYLTCPTGTADCHSVRQDFQSCFMTWQEGRTPELRTESYPSHSPGAFGNDWAHRTSRGATATGSGYTQDDAGYTIAEAYERVGAAVRVGNPTGPAGSLGDTRYLSQVFRGGEYGRALVVFDPENSIVSSTMVSPLDVILVAPLRMRVARDATGTASAVVYGQDVSAVVLRTGFLDWYETHDGVRRLGAPLDDEYIWPPPSSYTTAPAFARQDFESGNCLLWIWDRPGVGHATCGRIVGVQCLDSGGATGTCPFVGIAIDGGSGRPVPLGLPPGGSGSEAGGGDPAPPDSGTPMSSPDAGVPGITCAADTDCPGYGSGWRCQSGTCHETDTDGDGHTVSMGDCNPDVARIHPGATETCDRADENCNGIVDDGFDLTSDSRNCGACGTSCASGSCIAGVCVEPCSSHPEVCGDHTDNNCNGTTDEGCAPVCTPVAETCNGIDENCNGTADDGVPDRTTSNACGPVVERCMSGVMTRVSGRDPVAETCNNADDNCDGSVDNGLTRSCSTLCGTGSETCSGGRFVGCSAPVPGTETCNGIDDDCDGTIDEDGCAPMSTGYMVVELDPSVAWCPTGGTVQFRNWDNTGVTAADLEHFGTPPLSVPISSTGILLNGSTLNNTIWCSYSSTAWDGYFSPRLVAAAIGSRADAMGVRRVMMDGYDITSSVRVTWDFTTSERTNTTALTYHRVQIMAQTTPWSGCFGSTCS